MYLKLFLLQVLSLDLKIDPEGGGTGFRILSQLDTGEQFSLSYTQSNKYIQVMFNHIEI